MDRIARLNTSKPSLDSFEAREKTILTPWRIASRQILSWSYGRCMGLHRRLDLALLIGYPRRPRVPCVLGQLPVSSAITLTATSRCLQISFISWVSQDPRLEIAHSIYPLYIGAMARLHRQIRLASRITSLPIVTHPVYKCLIGFNALNSNSKETHAAVGQLDGRMRYGVLDFL